MLLAADQQAPVPKQQSYNNRKLLNKKNGVECMLMAYCSTRNATTPVFAVSPMCHQTQSGASTLHTCCNLRL